MDQIIKYLNCFADGRNYAGKIDSVTPPVLTRLVEEYRAGGMNCPIDIDMGIEKMEASFVLSAYDRHVVALWGNGSDIALVFRGAAQSRDGTVLPVVQTMRGLITTLDRGDWTAGEKATLTATMSLSYYQEKIGDEVIHDIDPVAMQSIVAGVDTMEPVRAALGV